MNSPREDTAAARARALELVADSVGELMRFWNFKPSMGRVWAVLYLAAEPLDAEGIEQRSGLSSGAVSSTLAELQQWGVVRRVPAQAGSKRRTFEAETDILALVARVFRERELRLIDQTVRQLEEAVALLERDGSAGDATEFLHSRFLVTRVRRLLELTRAGQTIVMSLANTGNADLTGLRGVLGGVADRWRDFAARRA